MADLFRVHPYAATFVGLIWLLIVVWFVREVTKSARALRRSTSEPNRAAMEEFKAKIADFNAKKRNRQWYWAWYSESGNARDSDYFDSPPPGFWARVWQLAIHGKRCVVIEDLE